MEVLTRLGKPYEEWIGWNDNAAKIYADYDNDEFYVLVNPAIRRIEARELEDVLYQLGLDMLSEEEAPAEDVQMSYPRATWKKVHLIPLDLDDED